MLSIKDVGFFVLPSLLAWFIEPVIAQDSSANIAQTSTTVSEGVGTSADEALKDAFRNAVRQEVGAVVDAETLVENDEVIEDKVLTYSDGFIKTYEEIPSSKKTQDGLHRIKIKARVERRSVIAKLTESNIAVKEIDGRGLFAEVVTGEEARQNSTEIVKKALAELPKLWVAEPIGKPDFDKDTSEVVVKVGVKIDAEKYKAFFEKVTPILDKVALRKSTVLTKSDNRLCRLDQINDKPLSDKEPASQWKLLLCNPTSPDNANLRWTLYVLDASATQVLKSIEIRESPNEVRRHGEAPINDTLCSLRVELCKGTGELVKEDDRLIGSYDLSPCPGLLTTIAGETQYRMDSMGVHRAIRDFQGFRKESPSAYFQSFIAPVVFSEYDHFWFHHDPILMQEFRIKVSLDELKAIQSVRCKLVRE